MADDSGDHQDVVSDLVEDAVIYLTEKQYPDGCSSNKKRQIRKKAEKFLIQDEDLWYKPGKGKPLLKYIRNRSDQLRIVKSMHVDPTSGHLGIRKTSTKIKERFMWKGIWEDVRTMISTCDECQRVNSNQIIVVPELHPVPVHHPWYHVAIDFIGPIHPISRNGNRFVLTLSDYFTKWVEAIPLPSKCSEGVAKSLFKIFMRMGLPKVLTSDQGGEFRSDLEKKIMALLKIRRHYITPYHPQANGLDERWNQTLKRMIIKFTTDKKDQWDEFLDTSVFAYNTSKHESTLYSPFELMFGRKAILPIEVDLESKDGETLLKEVENTTLKNDDVTILTAARQESQQAAKRNVKVAQMTQKQQYDQKHSRPPKFAVGMKVLKKDFTRKNRKGGGLDPKWLGPFVVTKDLSKGFFSLRSIESGTLVERVHGAHLKIYFTPLNSPEASPIVSGLSTDHDRHDLQSQDSVSPLMVQTLPPEATLESSISSQGGSDMNMTDDCILPPQPTKHSTKCRKRRLSSSGSWCSQPLESITNSPSSQLSPPISLPNMGVPKDSFSVMSSTESPLSTQQLDMSFDHEDHQSSSSEQCSSPVEILQAISTDLLVKSISEILAKVDNITDAPFLFCNYEKYQSLSSRKHNELTNESNSIFCITEDQYLAIVTYLLETLRSKVPDSTDPFKFVVNVLFPGVMQKLIMDKFSINCEEARNIMHMMRASKPILNHFKEDHSMTIKADDQVLHPTMEDMTRNTEQSVKKRKKNTLNKGITYTMPTMPEFTSSITSKLPVSSTTCRKVKSSQSKVSLAATKYKLEQREKSRCLQSHQPVNECIDLTGADNNDTKDGCRNSKQIWIKEFGLFDVDEHCITNGGWLNDKVLTAGQTLLKEAHPNFGGLQDTLFGEKLCFDVAPSSFIQVLNVNDNHWITVSRSSREAEYIEVYDSLPPSTLTVPFKVQEQIAAIICTSQKKVKLRMQNVQRQIGGNDCGLFALAFATSLCLGEDPVEVMYIQHAMRTHLHECLMNRVMTSFPKRDRKRRCTRPVYIDFDVYCYCRQPGSGKMIECDGCHDWFHKACASAPSSVWQNKISLWKCSDCSR